MLLTLPVACSSREAGAKSSQQVGHAKLAGARPSAWRGLPSHSRLQHGPRHTPRRSPVQICSSGRDASAPSDEPPSFSSPRTLPTLAEYLSENADDPALASVLESLAAASQHLAGLISQASIYNLMGADGGVNSSGDGQKTLDVVANDVYKAALRESGHVGVMASEEDEAPEVVRAGEGPYTVVFDPLDGSRNIAASIPTGSIFGVYRTGAEGPGGGGGAEARVLQAGAAQVAAGYALYSSATMVVLSVGRGTAGFTLDAARRQFVLTHPAMAIPPRGQIYSVNDARYFDWPEGLRWYITAVRRGQLEAGVV